MTTIEQSRAWRPLLEKELANAAHATIERITEQVGTWVKQGDAGCSLAFGGAGAAVFHAYLGEARGEDALRVRGREILRECLDRDGGQVVSPCLFDGWAGIGWALEVLHRGKPGRDEGVGHEVDLALMDYLENRRGEDGFDLVSGLAGLGVYALERSHVPSGVALWEKVLELLSERSVTFGEGKGWYTAPSLLPEWQRENYPEGLFDLGLAHGVPGVAGLLARSVLDGRDDNGQAAEMLQRTVRGILSQAITPVETRFPRAVPPLGSGEGWVRTGWCYGDLGIAVALFAAGQATGRSEWAHTALRTAREVAGRSFVEMGIEDPWLCHGGAGVGHLFNRLYQATGDETCRAAACRMFEWTLDRMREDRWDSMGLLEGAVGCGLALVAATSSLEPVWDRVLLTALPSCTPGPKCLS